MNSLTSEGFNTSLGSIRNIIGDVILLGPSEVTTIDANFTLKESSWLYYLPELELYQGAVYRLNPIFITTLNAITPRAVMRTIYLPQNPSNATYYFECTVSDNSTTLYLPIKNIITSTDKNGDISTYIRNEASINAMKVDILYVRLS